jgi:tetratricopeptide (TPR) repeat protein
MQCTRVFPALAALVFASVVPTLAGAQESALDATKAAAHARAVDADAALAYGRALRRAGMTKEAAQELRRGLAFTSGKVPLAIAIRFEIARTAIDSRNHAAAMAECRAIAPLAGGATPSHACLAEAHLMWRRASEALVETEAALAGGTQSFEAKVAEGRAYELELKEDEAEKAFREAIAWKPDAWEGHLALGHLLTHPGARRAEGVAELKRAWQLDGNGPEVNYELGRSLGSTQEGAGMLRAAVHERPTFVEALRRLADVEMDLQNLPEARKAAEAALKTDPHDAGSHIVMGRVALAENKPDDAIKEGNAVAAIVANSAHAKMLIGDAYAKKGEVDLAVEAYQAAYGFDHAEPSSLVHASRACHAAGRETSAKAFAEKATKEFPDWAPGWVALGDTLVANKEVASARSAYETALRSRGPLDAAAVQAKLAALK